MFISFKPEYYLFFSLFKYYQTKTKHVLYFYNNTIIILPFQLEPKQSVVSFTQVSSNIFRCLQIHVYYVITQGYVINH